MAKHLNEYFSSLFSSEDNSALPVPHIKFDGREWDYLWQLIVTQIIVTIRDMKDNKSPGVDGIPPKLLLEIVAFRSQQCYNCH